ncbi:SDR family oxidoreductase [Cupriavidus numazuensis]|uniref:3-phenylpropionate-dihydrodiol/cinnamic acid-dihydrodiol dehydrogenase n=1 Tax=Cupriavidus numazuensis TaxID=221992 RepID=A0ABN7PYG7_9BURK|nr:SDR family oxidoreductase [Cupriavidus numazuensis]CAG2140300.1 3-phenylpropionate-dihydrodiol/cinnamic acid-dihydrodiol dehydrogenase [Cupriavidus numazuensis]
MAPFTGKVVLITGASDGIGAELALLLAQQGARLALAARRLDMLHALASRIQSMRPHAEVAVWRTDVSNEAACTRLVADVVAYYGGLDALVNNAGVSAHGYFEQVSDYGYYETVMRVNYFGAMWCTRAALPHLRARRGLMVAVSSLAGKVGVPGRTAYSASKFALAGFCEALRCELLGSGVDICVVFPGVVATDTRVNGFGPNGRALGESRLREDDAMTAQECARQMLAAMTARKRELVMTAKGRLGQWLKLLAPAMVDRMALKALKHAGR